MVYTQLVFAVSWFDQLVLLPWLHAMVITLLEDTTLASARMNLEATRQNRHLDS